MNESGQLGERFAVVGGGRAGLSISQALTESGWHLDGVYGRNTPPQLANQTDIVILAVPDGEIGSVASAITPGKAVMLHLSGATGLDVLSPHAHVGSVHPLMSLPNPNTGAARLRSGGYFAVAGHNRAGDVVASLGGKTIHINDVDRPLYHATATIAANHLVALCAQVERLAKAVDVPFDAYLELMLTTLENVMEHGPKASLTGPAARGDVTTLARHLQALGPEERGLYQALASEAAAVAGREIDWGSLSQ